MDNQIITDDSIGLWSRMTKSRYFVLSMLLIYSLIGFLGNLSLSLMSEESIHLYMNYIILGKTLTNLSVFLFMLLSIGKYKWTLKDWGFRVDRRIFISFVFIIGISIVVFNSPRCRSMSIDNLFFYEDASLFLEILFASAEEFIFRVALISQLLRIFGDTKWGGFKAVILSSLVFVFVHIPLKPIHELLTDTLPFSILTGYIYYYTRSALYPIYAHAMANTIGASGFTGGLISIIAYFVIESLPKLKKKLL